MTKTIIYFHGLDSSLSAEKRKVLSQFGKVIAPTFNYRDSEVIAGIGDLFDDIDLHSTVLIGTSFGGYLANVNSLAYDIPCLLFNPALAYRSVDLTMAEPFDAYIQSSSYVVLGRLDDVIKCDDNLLFINQQFKGPTEVVIEETMGHRVPLKTFEKHVEHFFSNIQASKLKLSER